MLVNVKLHGPIAEEYGATHELNVVTVVEAVAAMEANNPGFSDLLASGGYSILVGGREPEEWEISLPLQSCEVEIVAVSEGEIDPATIISAILYFAASYVLTDIINSFFPPETPKEQLQADEAGYYFNGPVNVMTQGSPVPVLYGGPLLVGSRVVGITSYNGRPGVVDKGVISGVEYDHTETTLGINDEDKNLLNTVEVVDVICEGEIKGPAGAGLLNSVLLNGTRIAGFQEGYERQKKFVSGTWVVDNTAGIDVVVSSLFPLTASGKAGSIKSSATSLDTRQTWPPSYDEPKDILSWEISKNELENVAYKDIEGSFWYDAPNENLYRGRIKYIKFINYYGDTYVSARISVLVASKNATASPTEVELTAGMWDALASLPAESTSEVYFGSVAPESPTEGMFWINPGEVNRKAVNVALTGGTQNQGVIKGLIDESKSSSITSVGADVLYSAPVSRTVTNPDVDGVDVEISFPSLFSTDNRSGDLKGASVRFKITVQASASAETVVIQDRVSGYYLGEHRVTRRIELSQYGSAPYTIRVYRVDPDDKGSKARTAFSWYSYSEIINARFRFPNTVVAKVTESAEKAGSISSRAYLLYGRLINVPSNYDPETRVYTGGWDGTFKKAWTDNPAWIYYDMLIEDRFGLGDHVPSSLVNKWALYTIAQYCDEPVDDGFGGTEPRFSCSIYIQNAEEAYKVMSDLASVFRGAVYWGSGTVEAIQDSPSTAVAQFTSANVVDGLFSYSGMDRQSRYSVVLVTWNDPEDSFKQAVEYVEDREAIDRFGYRELAVTSLGCTSRGQARRAGLAILLGSKLEPDTVQFSAGLDSMKCVPGQVIKVIDKDRNPKSSGGRILGITATDVTLDRGYLFDSAETYTLTLVDASGQLVTRSLSGLNGELSAVTVSPQLSPVPAVTSVWTITPDSEGPELFRVGKIEEDSSSGNLVFKVTARKYAPEKYAQIDATDGIDTSVKRNYTDLSVVAPPTNVKAFSLISVVLGTLKRVLKFEWLPSQDKLLRGYKVVVKFEGQEILSTERTTTEAEVEADNSGRYSYSVRAVNLLGNESDPSEDNIDLPDIIVPPQPPISGLELRGAGNGTEFYSSDAQIVWRKGSLGSTTEFGTDSEEVNTSSLDPWFKDYRIQVSDPDTGQLLRTEYTTDQSYVYTIRKNLEDGGPRRSISISVQARDVAEQVGQKKVITVTNPPPPLPTAVNISSEFKSATIEFTPPNVPDFIGLRVWISEVPGFTPAEDTLSADVLGSPVTITNLPRGGGSLATNTAYYIKFAAYDDFSKDDLNFSAEYKVVTKPLEVPDLSGLGPWATKVDKTDRDWILAQFTDGAVPSEKIENLTAAKITSGIIIATLQIGSEGLIRAYNVASGYESRRGLEEAGGTVSFTSSSITGTFTPNEVVTFDSGAKGHLLSISGTTVTFLHQLGKYAVGDTMYASLGSAVIDSVDNVVGSEIYFDRFGNPDTNTWPYTADVNGNIVMSGSLKLLPGSQGIDNLSDAGALASQDNVDWASQVYGTGKPADNADVTSANTAAAISGQGALATSNTADWVTQVAGSGKPADNATVGADYDTNITNKPQIFRIAARGYSSATHPVDSGIYENDGTSLIAGSRGRSYTVNIFDRATGAWDSHTVYDVYIDAANATAMASALNTLGSDKIVVINSHDEPNTNHLANGLDDAIYRCGGSKAIYGSANFKNNSAYILIGIPGIGQGNGLELYSGDINGDPDAWIDTSVTIKNGAVQLGGISVRNAVDISYSDGTVVDDLKPAQAGADVTSANTAAAISGQGALATSNTADWSTQVIGAGKPANNADVTNYSDYRVSNITEENSTLTVARPVGASNSYATANVTGAIVVTLPQSWTSTMVKMAIDVFDYVQSKSFTALVGGYTFATTPKWVNEFAQIIGSISGNNRVRFGHDGIKCVIVIGDTTTVWQYPKIVVRDFQAGHNNYERAKWESGWAVAVLSDLTGYTFTGDFSDALLDAKSIKGQGALATTDTADWATQVGGTGKPADNADVTADSTLGKQIVPAGINIGGYGDVRFTANTVGDGSANDGEIRVRGTVYYHPDGTKRTVNGNTAAITPWEGAVGQDTFFLMWSNVLPATRFGGTNWGANCNFLPVVYDAAADQWSAVDNANTRYQFAPLTTDAIVARGWKTSSTGGIDGIVSLLGSNSAMPDDYAAASDSNLIFDPNFAKKSSGVDYWPDKTQTIYGATLGENGTPGCKITANGTIIDVLENAYYPSQIGDVFYVKVRVYVSSDFSETSPSLFGSDTFDINKTNLLSWPSLASQQITKGAWNTIEGTITVTNASASYTRFRMTVRQAVTAGYVIFSGIYVSRVQAGADITSLNTAADTAAVNGRAAADVDSDAAAGATYTGDDVGVQGGLLPNWACNIVDSEGKPTGIRGVESSNDRIGLSFGDSTNTWMRITQAVDNQVAYGFPAIPIDDQQQYRVTIRHRADVQDTAGLYLRFNELASALPIGKTHIGAGVFESVTTNLTSYKDLTENGPFPASTWTDSTFTYTPTAGTQWASFSMYNWRANTVQYDVDAVMITPIAKTADQIAESAGRKWAGQSGADVTGNNTAAAIAGQGALATQNTADYGSQVSGTKPPSDADKTLTKLETGLTLATGGLDLGGNDARIRIGNALGYLNGAGVFVGMDGGVGKFSVGDPDAEKYLAFDGQNTVLGRNTELLGSDSYDNTNIYLHDVGCFLAYEQITSGAGASLLSGSYINTQATANQVGSATVAKQLVNTLLQQDAGAYLQLSDSVRVKSRIYLGPATSGVAHRFGIGRPRSNGSDYVEVLFTSDGNINAVTGNSLIYPQAKFAGTWVGLTSYIVEIIVNATGTYSVYINGSLAATDVILSGTLQNMYYNVYLDSYSDGTGTSGIGYIQTGEISYLHQR